MSSTQTIPNATCQAAKLPKSDFTPREKKIMGGGFVGSAIIVSVGALMIGFGKSDILNNLGIVIMSTGAMPVYVAKCIINREAIVAEKKQKAEENSREDRHPLADSRPKDVGLTRQEWIRVFC